LGAGLAWVGLEWRTRRGIAARFETEFARRVLGQLRANGSFKRWRWGMAAAAAGSVYLGVALTQQLPFVQSHHAQQRELARAAFVLAGWRHQPAADFRQRSYPPAAWLQQRAAGGAPQAQLVGAWQLLRGAGGWATDAGAAGPWLDRAEQVASQDPLWKAAKALHAVNQEAMPNVIKAAAEDLGRAADQGLVEARFWQARLYLADNSPLFDARRGVQLLQQAADRQHARAAHLLGERYAKGEGVRRDVGAARRYLLQAAGSGLVETREALQRLK
jgi:TPR repeat protein